MAEQELELMIQTVARAIADQIGLPESKPGKYDLWLAFVRLGAGSEQRVLPARKLLIEATTPKKLLYAVATQVVLAVFGAEVRVVEELPNLMLRVLDRKGTVRLPGAPPLEQEGQIFLKVTVQRHEPGLWQRLFGGGEE